LEGGSKAVMTVQIVLLLCTV